MTTLKTTTLAAAAALLFAGGLRAQDATPAAAPANPTASITDAKKAEPPPPNAGEGVFDASKPKPASSADDAVFEDKSAWHPHVFLAVGPSIAYFTPNGSGAKDLFMYGGSIAIGFYPFKNNRVTLDIGYFTGSKQTDTVAPSDAWLGLLTDEDLGGDARSHIRYERTTEQFHVPIVFSWEYEFPFAQSLDGTERWVFHLGPSVGGTYVDISAKHTGVYGIYEGGDLTATVPLDDLVSDRNASGSKFLINYGVTVGFSYDCSRAVSRWIAPTGDFSFDFQYRFRGQTQLEIGTNDYGTSFAHQISASIVWRF